MNRTIDRDALGQRLASLPVPLPPEDLAGRIKAAIPPVLPRPVPVPRPSARRGLVLPFPGAWRERPRGIAASIALHAALIAFAGLAGWWLRGGTPPDVPFATTRASSAPRAAGVLEASLDGGYVDAARQPVTGFDLEPRMDTYATAVDRLRMGFLPPRGAVRGVDAVNAFDYGDAPPQHGDLALYAEGTPLPAGSDAAERRLRFAFRARTAGSGRLVGLDADAKVEFDARVVDRYRLVASHAPAGEPGPGEALVAPAHTITTGESVSAVYDVRLSPRPSGDRVATFTVNYRRPGDGALLTAARELRLGELSASWAAAPPRLRLAALAAQFADALDARDDVRHRALADVQRETEALHTAYPDRADIAQLQELARLALDAHPDPTADAVVHVESGTPLLVSKVEPVYPHDALAARLEGTVMLQAVVDETGRVRDIRVLQSVPPLDGAAIAAVRQWRYAPARVDGRAVPGAVTVGVSFRLK